MGPVKRGIRSFNQSRTARLVGQQRVVVGGRADRYRLAGGVVCKGDGSRHNTAKICVLPGNVGVGIYSTRMCWQRDMEEGGQGPEGDKAAAVKPVSLVGGRYADSGTA